MAKPMTFWDAWESHPGRNPEFHRILNPKVSRWLPHSGAKEQDKHVNFSIYGHARGPRSFFSTLTDAQKRAIIAGEVHDLPIGDPALLAMQGE